MWDVLTGSEQNTTPDYYYVYVKYNMDVYIV